MVIVPEKFSGGQALRTAGERVAIVLAGGLFAAAAGIANTSAHNAPARTDIVSCFMSCLRLVSEE
jgi:hypothetical protein